MTPKLTTGVFSHKQGIYMACQCLELEILLEPKLKTYMSDTVSSGPDRMPTLRASHHFGCLHKIRPVSILVQAGKKSP